MFWKPILSVLVLSVASYGTTVYSVSGTPTDGFTLGSSVDAILVGSWTQTGTYTNVSISAVVSRFPSAVTISAYLTNAIGAGTTALSNQIAASTANPSGSAPETDSLFSGLTLGPGTYYLVLRAPTGTSTTASWWGNSTGTTVNAADVTPGSFFTANTVGSGTPNDSYAPASTFVPAGIVTFFTVTSTAVPEPSSLALLAAGSVLFIGNRLAMFLRGRRNA